MAILSSVSFSSGPASQTPAQLCGQTGLHNQLYLSPVPQQKELFHFRTKIMKSKTLFYSPVSPP